MAEENGLVQIYYGDGKGKTTAAFGLAFRCAGWGRRVVIAQFLKSSPCGELTAAERFPTLTVLRSKGIHKFTFQMNDEEKAVVAENCRTLLRQAAELARAEDARLLVLDEVIDALRGFLPQEELCAFLDERPAGLEVVLTGHSLPEALERRADYITPVSYTHLDVYKRQAQSASSIMRRRASTARSMCAMDAAAPLQGAVR